MNCLIIVKTGNQSSVGYKIYGWDNDQNNITDVVWIFHFKF